MPTPPDMSSTGRHGFAVMREIEGEKDLMIAWIIAIPEAIRFPDHKIVNVQNGAFFIQK